MALRQVPVSMREAAFALGATEPTVVFKVVLPGAASGVVTGALSGPGDLGGRNRAADLYRRLVKLSVERPFHERAGRLPDLRDLRALHRTAERAIARLAFAAAFLVMLVVLAINSVFA